MLADFQGGHISFAKFEASNIIVIKFLFSMTGLVDVGYIEDLAAKVGD